MRVLARLLRWKLREPNAAAPPASILTAAELSAARWKLVRSIQREFFYEEISHLNRGKTLNKTCKLKSFAPFLDAEGTLRVGGRLQHALLPENEKHPAIVPNNSHLAELLIRECTRMHSTRGTTAHAEPPASCVLDRTRTQPHTPSSEPVHSMCALPTSATSSTDGSAAGGPRHTLEALHFDRRGLRWAILPAHHQGRGHKAFKDYVAIFVCMATRATHLEVVSDCTTQGFLAALRRFVARRCLCSIIYSDNATNFQGADAELQRLFNEASEASRSFVSALASDGIEWRFIPPRAPYFGGLWETGVRSFKHHLRRVLGDSKLTFEEFSTLVAQIEACLNSRPLGPLSVDPGDVTALTPGYFLVS